ncbi:hypothetical protein Tco_0875026 [Tanacetum coccineum]|uniref:Uncharacterized protein n=1 Tax=Tanacetum coccineum TaxID=301880 RepID=A0ABQ5BNB2_9ASTR
MHDDAVQIPLIGSSKDTKFQEADFDLESMHDDEIEFVFRLEVDDDDEKDDHSKHKAKLSKTDEAVVDDVIDELVADKIDDSVPRMVVDALEERLPELLSDTLKKILLDLLKDFVKKALPKFDKRVKKTLKVKVLKIILKPLNKEFNALNKMESRRVPRDIMIINAKQLQTKVEKNAVDIHELVELTKKIVRLIDLALASTKAATKGDKESQKQSNPSEDVPSPLQGKQVVTNSTNTECLYLLRGSKNHLTKLPRPQLHW